VTEGSHDTFTGAPLASLTLAQRLIELRIDQFERLGLAQGFTANLEVFGLVRALGFALARWRLGAEGAHARAASLNEQVRENIASIEADPLATRDAGYRDGQYLAELTETLHAFETATSPGQAATLRAYLIEHERELASERRRLERAAGPEAHSKRARENADRRARVFAWLDHVALPLALIALPFACGYIAWRSTLRAKRPEATVLFDAERALSGSEVVTRSTHPAVRVAAALHDVAALTNQATNVALGHRAQQRSLEDLHGGIQTRSTDAARAATEARERMAQVIPSAREVARATAMLDQSWQSTFTENTHTVESCTTTRDSDGRERQSCSTHTVCDSHDHTWTFSVASARAGLAALDRARATIPVERYSVSEIAALQRAVRASPSSPLRDARLDVLRAEPVAALLAVEDAITPLATQDAAGTSLSWIRAHYESGSGFPARASERTGCSTAPSPPNGFVLVRSFSEKIRVGAERLDVVDARLAAAGAALASLRSASSALAQRARNGRAAMGLEDEHLALDDRSNDLYRSLHDGGMLRFADARGRNKTALFAAIAGALLSVALWMFRRSQGRADLWRKIARARGR
jgi:hypothetical protein